VAVCVAIWLYISIATIYVRLCAVVWCVGVSSDCNILLETQGDVEVPPQQPLKCPDLLGWYVVPVPGGVSPVRTTSKRAEGHAQHRRWGTSDGTTGDGALPPAHRRPCNARCGGYDRNRCLNATTSDPLATQGAGTAIHPAEAIPGASMGTPGDPRSRKHGVRTSASRFCRVDIPQPRQPCICIDISPARPQQRNRAYAAVLLMLVALYRTF
jgi:hypothetical protein